MEFKLQGFKITKVEFESSFPHSHTFKQDSYVVFTFSREFAPNIEHNVPIAIVSANPMVKRLQEAFTHGKYFSVVFTEESEHTPLV